MNIVSLPPAAIRELADAADRAIENGTRLRIQTYTDRAGRPGVKWDAGAGWIAGHLDRDAERFWHLDGSECLGPVSNTTSSQGFCWDHDRVVRNRQPVPEGTQHVTIIGR